LLFAGTFFIEMKRGFGRAVFDLAALLLAIKIVWALHEPLSGAVHLVRDTCTNQAVLYALGFLITGGALVFLGRLVHSATLVSTDVFEPILGGLCGLAIAIIASHALVQTIALGVGVDTVPVVIADSVLGTEFLRFDTYHRVVELLYHFDRPPEV
jgi:hypothetical protein